MEIYRSPNITVDYKYIRDSFSMYNNVLSTRDRSISEGWEPKSLLIIYIYIPSYLQYLSESDHAEIPEVTWEIERPSVADGRHLQRSKGPKKDGSPIIAKTFPVLCEDFLLLIFFTVSDLTDRRSVRSEMEDNHKGEIPFRFRSY